MSEQAKACTPTAEWKPYGESIDLNEYPNEILRLKVCRSFRADLRHKLEIILRAHGGRGKGGLRRSAWALGVTRRAVQAWLRWTRAPGSRVSLERIDDVYEESIEKLVAEKCRRKRRKRPVVVPSIVEK